MQKKTPTFESSPERLAKTPSERDPKGSAMTTIRSQTKARLAKTERLRAMRLAASGTTET